jgi:hypothetical protein
MGSLWFVLSSGLNMGYSYKHWNKIKNVIVSSILVCNYRKNYFYSFISLLYMCFSIITAFQN